MLNEGMTLQSTRSLMRSEMVKQLHRLGEATPDAWERAVFESLTGRPREDVDWDFEDNQAGYYSWLKSFDQLAHELVEDGFATTAEADGRAVFRPVDSDPAIDWTRLVHPRPA